MLISKEFQGRLLPWSK